MEYMLKLFDRVINKSLLIRRVNIVANNVVKPESVKNKPIVQQFDLFSNNEEQEELKRKELEDEKEEKKVQEVLLNIKSRFGKNAILKGMNLEEGGTTIERNGQVGGHKG
jgi:DNA polymerase V